MDLITFTPMNSSFQPQPAIVMNQNDSIPCPLAPASTNGRWEHCIPSPAAHSGWRWAGLLALVVACAAVVLSPPGARAASASPPGKVAYQGFLTDANGVPLGNDSPVNTNVIFRIFNASIGGTLKWAEQQVVTVDKGHFSIFLGEGAQVGGEPFSGDLTSTFGGVDASDRFIEITVGSTTIAPRLQFLPAPYSILAANARYLVGPNGSPLADTVGGLLTVPAGLAVNGNGGSKINLHSAGDPNHYIGYNVAVDGPSVVGWNGGTLGTRAGGDNNVLHWYPGGITLNGTLTVVGGALPIQLPSTEGPKINLWGTSYGLGITPGTVTLFSGSDIALGLGNYSLGGGELARFKGNGNVGIGTANPAARMHVIGPIRASGSGPTEGFIDMNPPFSDNRPGYISWWRNSSTRLGYMGYDTYGPGNIGLVLENSANFVVGNGNLIAMNNVGIGVGQPSQRLDVGDRMRIRSGGNGSAGLFLNNNVGDRGFIGLFDDNTIGIWGQGSGYSLYQNVNNGNVGVATGNPGTKFQVNGTMSVINGYLGVGTAGPNVPLEVRGWSFPYYYNTGSGAYANNGQYNQLGNEDAIGADGNKGLNGFPALSIYSEQGTATRFVVLFSDQRIKELVNRSDSRQDLQLINRLKVTDYRMKDRLANGNGVQKGLIAQEVHQVIPGAVRTSRE